MTEAKREIRQALLGRTQPCPDGRLEVLKKGETRMPLGVTDGAGAVRFLGICKKARRLKAACPEQKARLLAAQIMQDVGRELSLSEQPEAAACLIRYVLTRPAVLVFDYQDGVPVVTAWTGRGLTGWISLRRALRAFTRRLPKELRVTAEPAPPDADEVRKKERKEIRREAKRKLKEQKNRKKAKKSSGQTGS
jgi:hypothetical protein